MFNFNYYTPTQVVFGKDTVEQVGDLVKKYGGTRVLVHFGGQSAVKSGLIDRVKASLDAAGIFHVELGGVVPNPHLSKVYEGIALAKENNIDFLLPVGGGSVIDSAKAIAYALYEPEEDVWDLYGHTRQSMGSFPLGAVVTIAAAGSEMSDSSVITNEKTGEKRGYNSDICRPKFAIMDPSLTLTLPDYQTMSGCVDIMMHTMERYFTKGGNMELTDELAEGLMRTVKKYAEILHKDPENYDARAEIMWANSLSHNGLTGCGNGGNDFASHRLEHEMGGMFDVTHGAGLAAVWPSWARYVYKEIPERFVRFAEKVMGVERTEGMSDEDVILKGISSMEDFYRSIDMPTNMRELGIEPTEEQILEMANGCARATGGKVGSAKVLYEEDMAAIYRMAI
ncbi:MAG: iron-containing alcohol dehydrogenase [Firmicutes bacterium]|nr:iron-containing alcohol dehydrogenase [Bacillota bacterium]